MIRLLAGLLFSLFSFATPSILLGAATPPQPAQPVKPSPILKAMDLELGRSIASLQHANPPAYFVSYAVTGQTEVTVQGSNGALLESDQEHNRLLQTQVRVGSYQFDDTHNIGDRSMSQSSGPMLVPLDDNIPVFRRDIWLSTDEQYRNAAAAYIRVKTSRQVQVQNAETTVADFSHEQPHVAYLPLVSMDLNRRPWEERVRRYTAAFSASPAVMNSIATFTASATNQYFASSEGTREQFGQIHYRLELYLQGKAPDGMNLGLYGTFDWVNPANAPSNQKVMAEVHKLIGEMQALQKAPVVEPFAGPTLLSGPAAAVFFHEVLGHRLEGFRQKQLTEGQTFTKKVGQVIMPTFLSVYDDPTLKEINGHALTGYYPFDDEGVPAQRVTLVDHGVLKNFLMSRSPLPGFPHSNGHGRRQLGYQPIARMGNTIVRSSNGVPFARLRKMLIQMIRRENKPFGLLIEDLSGGFTITGRAEPQAFQLEPLIVYKVFPDGRPDELVRGANIVGTPLTDLTHIVATGDRESVFNGFCVDESGAVPVTADAPAMLFSQLEVAEKETSTDKPPILPPPAHDPLSPEPRGVKPTPWGQLR
ncbi:MAG TPA: metallopeptidase TldD-related protein [Patescibacteria group bacterium]|nr:metallopeptidase TldD-related protein [Patescibacteria group bacterium]